MHVQAVFRARRERLLRACQAYLAGTARVGTYGEASTAAQAAGTETAGVEDEQLGDGEEDEEEVTRGEAATQTTRGFQLVFKGVLPRLEKALMAL